MVEKDDQLFMQLIYIFHSSAMQGMGKLINPVTNKAERNMEQAQNAIDMLEMLKRMTKGNIKADLERILDSYLTDLRLNFVDESNKKENN